MTTETGGGGFTCQLELAIAEPGSALDDVDGQTTA